MQAADSEFFIICKNFCIFLYSYVILKHEYRFSIIIDNRLIVVYFTFINRNDDQRQTIGGIHS